MHERESLKERVKNRRKEGKKEKGRVAGREGGREGKENAERSLHPSPVPQWWLPAKLQAERQNQDVDVTHSRRRENSSVAIRTLLLLF